MNFEKILTAAFATITVLIVISLTLTVTGCTQSRVEYVTPTYAPLTDNIVKPNPKPQITEQNFIKWKDALIMMNEYEVWGTKESNRANTCVNIYQRIVGEKNEYK